MRMELIQPFINAADAVFAESLQAPTKIVDLSMDEETYRRKGVAALILRAMVFARPLRHANEVALVGREAVFVLEMWAPPGPASCGYRSSGSTESSRPSPGSVLKRQAHEITLVGDARQIGLKLREEGDVGRAVLRAELGTDP